MSLRVWVGKVASEDLTPFEQEKLRLFESLHPEPDKTPQEQFWEIGSLIEDKRIEKENTANAREARKAERHRREKERNAERAEARKEDRFITKHVKADVRQSAYLESLLNYFGIDAKDPWR